MKLNIFIGVVCLVAGIALCNFTRSCGLSGCNNSVTESGETVVIPDTLVLERLVSETKTDTLVKWYELWKDKILPGEIRIQKIHDTVFIEQAKKLDLMLRVKKKGNTLLITALNIDGKVLKEMVYNNVQDDFTAVSQEGNVSVTSKSLYWNGINLEVNYSTPVNKLEYNSDNYEGKLTTGINWKEKFFINSGLKYETRTDDLSLTAGIKINLFK